MLFTSFGGQLMMSLHCPNRHEAKRILLFEMEESFDGIHIVNEVTGNWYNHVAGIAKGYAYQDPCVEEPCFSVSPVAKIHNDQSVKEEKGVDAYGGNSGKEEE